MTGVSRREFLSGALRAVAGVLAVPSLLEDAVAGEGKRQRRLVVLLLRGAVDGLNVVIPHAEPSYFALRPSIAVPRSDVLDLDGRFGLHPALAPLHDLYRLGHLAFVHAAGSPAATRSHFEAQDDIESGTPGTRSTPDGWLNRCARQLPCHAGPLCAITAGTTVPRILRGRAGAFALASGTRRPLPDVEERAVRTMYGVTGDALLRDDAHEAFAATDRLRAIREPLPGRGGRGSGRGALVDGLGRVASLMRSDAEVRVAFAAAGGWDHHVNEGGVTGQLAGRLTELATALAGFWSDLGDLAADTVVVALSEFGRTVRENGTRGTDHGHGNVMLVLGGPVRGGAVYGSWPGLAPEQLYEGRDLAVTTDFRLVLTEILERHLGCGRVDLVFPGFDAGRIPRLGLLPQVA